MDTTKITEALLTTHADIGEMLCRLANGKAAWLREIADMLEEMRTLTSDIAVARDQEATKREQLDAFRQTADQYRAAADLIEIGPMPVTEVRDEIREALMAGASLADNRAADNPWTPVLVRTFLTERSNNIAQALLGRVLREGK